MKIKNSLSPALAVLLLTVVLCFIFNGCDYITGAAVEPSFSVTEPEHYLRNVSVSDAYAVVSLYAGRANFIILDVRTPEEYAGGHLPFSINRDASSTSFRNDIEKFDKDRMYLVYCQTGVRSAAASQVMAESGFKYIYNMTGGFSAWVAIGLPVNK
jgi:rhodanese-related sulfurtransferase